jgi:deoxyribonuclease-4
VADRARPVFIHHAKLVVGRSDAGHRQPAATILGTLDETVTKRRIGPHLPLGGGILKAVDRARDIGATAIQVFTDNPTAWRRRAELPRELAEFRQRLADYDIGPIAVHAPYLVNLCGADAEFWQQSVATVVTELRVGAAFGASLVNVHIGSHRGLGREQGLRQLGRGLRAVLEEANDNPTEDVPLLGLENSAGSGDGIGSSIEDLAAIVETAGREGVPEHAFGFCLDTAHLWAAGVCIDGPESVDSLVARIGELLGRERVAMLHLNDARTVCGSRVDRHQHIGAGAIGAAGLGAVLRHPWLASLPTYLETPGMDTGYDAINLERTRLLIRGEPLPTLPAEAFAARGSRSRTPAPAG